MPWEEMSQCVFLSSKSLSDFVVIRISTLIHLWFWLFNNT